jgi:hypothetical protein
MFYGLLFKLQSPNKMTLKLPFQLRNDMWNDIQNHISKRDIKAKQSVSHTNVERIQDQYCSNISKLRGSRKVQTITETHDVVVMWLDKEVVVSAVTCHFRDQQSTR